MPPEPDAALVDAVLTTSRALLAVAVRSLGAAEERDVGLTQYRALVVLASRGPQRIAALADALGVNPSTATRLCDRLSRKGLVRRRRSAGDRREVRVAVTEAGHRLVAEVTAARREEISGLVAAMPTEDRAGLVRGLRALAEAAGERPEPEWVLGWP